MSEPKKKTTQRLQFTYLADELGKIVETRPNFDGEGAGGNNLAPLRKPMLPTFIDTPEKRAMWNSYWDNVEGWWESERANERRENW